MKLNQNQLTDLLLQFAQDFCQKNQIDFSQVEDGVDYNEKSVKITLPIVPNGNMACIFKDAEVEFAIYHDETTMHTAVVRFSYSHPSGGSNGHSMNFIVLTKPSMREGVDYVGFITDPEIQVVLRHVNSIKGDK